MSDRWPTPASTNVIRTGTLKRVDQGLDSPIRALGIPDALESPSHDLSGHRVYSDRHVSEAATHHRRPRRGRGGGSVPDEPDDEVVHGDGPNAGAVHDVVLG